MTNLGKDHTNIHHDIALNKEIKSLLDFIEPYKWLLDAYVSVSIFS